jgi:von Willebrand factor type A domain
VDLVLLSPRGALVAVAVVVPLLALVVVRRRAKRARRTLGLVEPRAAVLVVPVVAMLAAAAFVGLAAAQPVVERTTEVRMRTDAEAYVVLDVSRSMLAKRGARGATRFERAKATAAAVRSALPEIRFGVASLTDRTLPHLFPSIDQDVFDATIDRSLGIERPPPRSSFASLATSLEALGTIRTHRYFARTTQKRLLLVFTDGESQPVAGARLGALFRRPPEIDVVFVHFWNEDERVFTAGAPEPQYRPDRSARVVLDGLAQILSGHVYAESEAGAAAQKARELLGSGPTVVRGEQTGEIALAPYLAGVAFAPLLLLLWRTDR